MENAATNQYDDRMKQFMAIYGILLAFYIGQRESDATQETSVSVITFIEIAPTTTFFPIANVSFSRMYVSNICLIAA